MWRSTIFIAQQIYEDENFPIIISTFFTTTTAAALSLRIRAKYNFKYCLHFTTS